MSIKLAILKSGEQIISDAKELVSDGKTVSYVFEKPHKVRVNLPVNVPEDDELDNRTVEITLSPWVLLSSEKSIPVPTDWVVTIVDPIEDLKTMYLNKVKNKTAESTNDD
jgi:hypothetical protein